MYDDDVLITMGCWIYVVASIKIVMSSDII